MTSQTKQLRVAFVVGVFPAVSETFIIDQICDLIDRGIAVEVFSFKKGSELNISQRYFDYHLAERTHYLAMPARRVARIIGTLITIPQLLIKNPRALLRSLNVIQYRDAAWSLRLFYWSAPFFDRCFDLYHCHFGVVADDFLIIRDIIGMKEKMVTTFYGYDVSTVVREHGPHIYDRLQKESSLFFVMSENMRDRVIAFGFDPSKVIVHPVGINTAQYPFSERRVRPDEPINIVSVGRFVEKKGFDDLLQALAIVKAKTNRAFRCHIIGDGPLKAQLHELAQSLQVEDRLTWHGFMSIQKIVEFFKDMHFFVQPSKTARNGDME